MGPKKTKRGGRQARIGFEFLKELDDIKRERIISNKSKYLISTEILTNLITKHELWKKIKKDIIGAEQEEVDKHGK